MRFHYLILACVLAHGALGDVVVPPPPTTTVTYDKLVGDLSEALVTRYQAGVTGLDTLATSWSTSVRSLSDQLTSGFAAYDANFCTPASFSKGKWFAVCMVPSGGIIPAKFIGSAFNLTFTTGSCSFNETAYLVDGVKELQCMEPSMEYLKVPAKYVSKYYAAPSFTGKECVLTKSFGTATNTTLTVFDTSLKVSASELTAQITAELKNLLSVLGKSS
ncbi:hypothetical protein F751_5475 [Auxenochlorella protothecoides]|uniref:Uncharacterized protein n=1 Tax=Auxenochlorella protothecoides TaxID=3075 RepID=A0A087STR5_AUXPR|nr:hypothetical protein F751_5475 [Auxenochlorella protothecoides]KFM29119.1 hypothetical protein F751_5475 [Auxenochlorella protothecoides]RMZ53482.1 hypothetical protein APUTEX25_003304 [Auxenochlorella protothecoides]|eukprot:RMZ53482.1 hypothetical protein APUTEX25_003304 [Auxenochlorella protothecoides]